MKQKVKWSDPGCKGQQDAIILKVMLLALCTEVAGPRQIYANTTWKKISRRQGLCAKCFLIFFGLGYGRHLLRV